MLLWHVAILWEHKKILFSFSFDKEECTHFTDNKRVCCLHADTSDRTKSRQINSTQADFCFSVFRPKFHADRDSAWGVLVNILRSVQCQHVLTGWLWGCHWWTRFAEQALTAADLNFLFRIKFQNICNNTGLIILLGWEHFLTCQYFTYNTGMYSSFFFSVVNTVMYSNTLYVMLIKYMFGLYLFSYLLPARSEFGLQMLKRLRVWQREREREGERERELMKQLQTYIKTWVQMQYM